MGVEMTDTLNQLLSCPFCGSPAQSHQYQGQTLVTCPKNNDCPLSELNIDSHCWNTRAVIQREIPLPEETPYRAALRAYAVHAAVNNAAMEKALIAYEAAKPERESSSLMGIEGLRPVDPAAFAPFIKKMEEEVIPEVERVLEEREAARIVQLFKQAVRKVKPTVDREREAEKIGDLGRFRMGDNDIEVEKLATPAQSS
jgi:hypothetical protein